MKPATEEELQKLAQLSSFSESAYKDWERLKDSVEIARQQAFEARNKEIEYKRTLLCPRPWEDLNTIQRHEWFHIKRKDGSWAKGGCK